MHFADDTTSTSTLVKVLNNDADVLIANNDLLFLLGLPIGG